MQAHDHTVQKRRFPLRISSFTEEIRNGKLHYFYSVIYSVELECADFFKISKSIHYFVLTYSTRIIFSYVFSIFYSIRASVFSLHDKIYVCQKKLNLKERVNFIRVRNIVI